MASTLSGAKYCCKCGSDVTGGKRMKDSGGKYWCLPCGQNDQKKKIAATGVICAGCGEQYPNSQLTQLGGQKYCSGCLKKQHSNSGGGIGALFDIKRYLPDGSGGDDGGRTKKMTIMLVLLVVAIVAANYFLH
jgi:hypothetical protein